MPGDRQSWVRSRREFAAQVIAPTQVFEVDSANTARDFTGRDLHSGNDGWRLSPRKQGVSRGKGTNRVALG
jgi:hypothetical protein